MTKDELKEYILQHQDATELDLSEKEITELPPEIGQLANLQELNLRGNQLTALPPEIGKLTNLQTLNIDSNQLTALPSVIGNLANLQKLNLGGNQLTALPSDIGRLANLRTLFLWGNKLTSLPSELWQLANLQTLNICYNKLTTLPPEIGYLALLQELFLGGNQFTALPPEIGRLANLQELWLWSNPLIVLPTEIGQLFNLQKLCLMNNKLTSLQLVITNLENLQDLDLQDNELTALPLVIGQLKNLKKLNLRDNPLPIPPEILEKTEEPETIIAWYLQNVLSGAPTRPLNEAKVVLVGQGKVGKTSLVKRLTKDEFDPHEPKTEGIVIYPWQVQADGEDIKLNLWDFGGQEIMHATHQFFLTRRTVYLLVLDSRQSEQSNRVEYWLKLIQSFGGDSPVIIVCNQCDEDEMAVNWKGLREKYPSIQTIVKRASCKTREGMLDVQDAITKVAGGLPHIHDALAHNWFEVKDELAKMHEEKIDFIPYSRYQEICRGHEITAEQDQTTLIGFLHDLGVVLHFRDHPILEDTNVLNPEWVTGGVYAIINHQLLKDNQGVLHINDLQTILDPELYPRAKNPFIVQMMQKFEMCHEFPGSGYSKFLISVTLPLEPPDLPAWQNPLRFQYRYEILPESVITRFITRMHAYIDGNLYWRHGVQLRSEDGTNHARVQADLEDCKIAIVISGRAETRRDLLKLIRSDFYKIHKSFGNLAVQEKIPLSDKPEVLVDYQHLLVLEEKGVQEHIPEGMFIPVRVKALLDGIEAEEERRERRMSEAKEGKGGDTYIIQQAGAVGPGAHAHDMQFQQIWHQVQGQIDLSALSRELETLKKHLNQEAVTPEHYQVVADVAAAETAAKAGNGSGMLEYLKKAGSWALDAATKIGTSVAAEVIKKTLGL